MLIKWKIMVNQLRKECSNIYYMLSLGASIEFLYGWYSRHQAAMPILSGNNQFSIGWSSQKGQSWSHCFFLVSLCSVDYNHGSLHTVPFACNYPYCEWGLELIIPVGLYIAFSSGSTISQNQICVKMS